MDIVLNEAELDTILRCLRAAVDGPFFGDADFRTLMGVDRKELGAIAERWPAFDEETAFAVHNVLGNLLWYPHQFGCELRERFGVDEDQMRRLLDRFSEAI